MKDSWEYERDAAMDAARRIDMVCRVCRNRPCYLRPAVCRWCADALREPMPWSPYGGEL